MILVAGAGGKTGKAVVKALFRYYAAHGLVGNPHALRRLLGRAPTSLSAFLHGVAAAA
ncbi:MAG TPA: hypothetical protein VEK75_02560 [Xanthobacteraceae bacterium]|nr:hypothetical protein [Xanthobacteraceae bacterium]